MATVPSSKVVNHEWGDARRLVTRELGIVEQLQCSRCGRDVIIVVSTQAIHAVAIRILSFWTLPTEVTERWVSECPGEPVAGDDQDRLRLVREITLHR